VECCPNCGEFVDALNDETGWCDSCSGVVPAQPSWYVLWLERNADEIERVMVIHCCSAGKAKQIVAVTNRPMCLCCKNPIKRGNTSRDLFCSATPECKRAQSTFRRLHRRLPRDLAIEGALVAAQILRLTLAIEATL
jgi:hypothetical protein